MIDLGAWFAEDNRIAGSDEPNGTLLEPHD